VALTADLTFDEGTDGANLVVAGPYLAVSGPPEYDDIGPPHGMTMLCINGEFVTVATSSVDNGAFSVHFEIIAVTSGVPRIITFTDAGTAFVGMFRAHTDGKFDIANGASTRIAASTASWSAGAYRVDGYLGGSGTARTVTLKVFSGDTNTSPVWDTAGPVAITSSTASAWTRSRPGAQGGTTGSIRIMRVRHYDTQVFAGPLTVPVSTTCATSWNTRAAVAATRATTWRALASIASSRATTWRAAARTTATRATTWRVTATVTGTRAATWDTLKAVFSSRASTWITRAVTTATRATSWRTTARVTATRATTWNVGASAAVVATRSTTWAVAGPVLATRATAWDTLARLTAIRATTWNTAAAVVAANPTTWDTFTSTTSDRAASWRVLDLVTAERATQWDVSSDLEPQTGEAALVVGNTPSSLLTATNPRPALAGSNAPSSQLEVSHGV
jgi:hypothetical protein